jgi:cysteine desulfurase
MLPFLFPEPMATNISACLVFDRPKGAVDSCAGMHRVPTDSPRLPQSFGNPSSAHTFGSQSRKALDLARHEVASLLNASLDDEIVFTGCGSESDNWAVRIALDNYHAAMSSANSGFDHSVNPIPHVVTSAIEHPAILSYLQHLRSAGTVSLTVVGVDREGFVDVGAVAAALTAHTCLVTIMHSNNEIGSIQLIADIAGVVRRFRGDAILPLLHSDAAQSVGKVEVDVRALGVDMLTIVGHKFGAPKGIAALFVRHGIPVK